MYDKTKLEIPELEYFKEGKPYISFYNNENGLKKVFKKNHSILEIEALLERNHIRIEPIKRYPRKKLNL